MILSELNPFLRFSAQMLYDTSYNGSQVRVSDCRLFSVLDGSGRLSIDGKHYSLSPGCLFYCCAGSCYSIHTHSSMRLLILNFDLSRTHSGQTLPLPPNRARNGWNAMPVYFDAVEGSSFLNSHLFLESSGEVLPLLKQLVDDHAAGGRFADALTSAALKELVTRLHLHTSGQLPPKVVQVQEYIEAHYAQPLTNARLAQLVGYHEYYLNRIFTAATGQSLHSYLLRIRLNRAGWLILNTDLELQTVGEQVGFGSYPHFSGCFKQAYGFSPAQYRKRLRSNI
jgi:AraC-like DNA-binding protein